MNTEVEFKHPYFRLTKDASPIRDVIHLYSVRGRDIKEDLFFHFKYNTHE